jgi:MYXO-CTERM domain-containing protein
VSCYFSQERGAGAVYPPTPFDPQEDPILEFDAFTFLDAIDERILEPMAKTRALFEDASHVTRMYTTISPDEMIEDPAFDFNSELEDVDNQHTAEQLMECNGSDWTVTLPQGMEVMGSGNTWPVDSSSDMPANLRIFQLSSKGEGMEIEDNSKTVASRLRELDVVSPQGGSGGSDVNAEGGGCRSAHHSTSNQSGWVAGLLLMGAALLRRRR